MHIGVLLPPVIFTRTLQLLGQGMVRARGGGGTRQKRRSPAAWEMLRIGVLARAIRHSPRLCFVTLGVVSTEPGFNLLHSLCRALLTLRFVEHFELLTQGFERPPPFPLSLIEA